MKQFIIYNGYGEILRSGFCRSEAFLLQATQGEFIMEGLCEPLAHYIYQGVIVAKPKQPSKSSKWNPINNLWDTNYAYTESQLRAVRNARLFKSDWVDAAILSGRISKQLSEDWSQYRQLLRDLPETQDLSAVVWPQPPIGSEQLLEKPLEVFYA